MNKILNIEFIENTKRRKFQLELISYLPLEVAGIIRENTFTLKVDNELYHLWSYLNGGGILPVVEKATIKQTGRGESDKNLPWIHTLALDDKEVIEFFPYECALLGEENE